MLVSPTRSIAERMDLHGIGMFNKPAISALDWFILIQEDNLNLQRTIVLRLSSSNKPEAAINYDYPRIIMSIRGLPRDYDEAYRVANLIKNKFQSHDPVTLNGDDYVSFSISREYENLPAQDDNNIHGIMELDLIVNAGDYVEGNRAVK